MRMEQIAAFIDAHPAVWLVIIALGALFVLRALAKLACLGVVIVGIILILGFGGAVMRGLA